MDWEDPRALENGGFRIGIAIAPLIYHSPHFQPEEDSYDEGTHTAADRKLRKDGS